MFRKLQHSIYEINAFFCISIVIAVLVLHHQDTSILGRTFALRLLALQKSVVTSMLVSQMYDSPNYDDKSSKLDPYWVFIYTGIYYALFIEEYIVKVPREMATIYRQLAKECHTQRGLIDISGYLRIPSAGNSSDGSLGGKKRRFFIIDFWVSMLTRALSLIIFTPAVALEVTPLNLLCCR